jgi:hypothetical protein
MQLVQFYETTIADRDKEYIVHFVTLPKKTIGEQGFSSNTMPALREALGLERYEELPSLSSLPYAIALILQGPVETVFGRLQKKTFDDLPRELIDFSEYAAFARVVPFEESPLDLQSVAGVLAKAKDSPLLLGATVGIMAAAGNTGLVLLGMVAAGIIIIYTADAVGKSLHELIPKWLRVSGSKSDGADSVVTLKDEGEGHKAAGV